MAPESSVPWLPLLQHLTTISSEWGVWKNADAVLDGHGDVDSVSTPEQRHEFIGAFSRWAGENGYGPVFICDHIPGVYLLIALDGRHLVELDLCELQLFRGSTLFAARDLKPMMLMDERGFRRLRPGAEGLLLLMLSGMRRGGGADTSVLQRKGIKLLLQQDWPGVKKASSLLGDAGRFAMRLARAVERGAWDRAAALRIEAHAALRALQEPRVGARRLSSAVVRNRRCAVWPVLLGGRRIDGEVGAWLRRIQQNHREATT